jgi:hypothetical protein
MMYIRRICIQGQYSTPCRSIPFAFIEFVCIYMEWAGLRSQERIYVRKTCLFGCIFRVTERATCHLWYGYGINGILSNVQPLRNDRPTPLPSAIHGWPAHNMYYMGGCRVGHMLHCINSTPASIPWQAGSHDCSFALSYSGCVRFFS